MIAALLVAFVALGIAVILPGAWSALSLLLIPVVLWLMAGGEDRMLKR